MKESRILIGGYPYIIMEKCIWICSSLFADVELWHLVLKNGVKKFGDENGAIQFQGFKLSFNFLSGSNIRLAYKVGRLQAEKFTKDLDTHFRSYFRDLAATQTQARPGNGLFMPMPAPTVKYGLYQLPSYSEPEVTDLETAISNCMIDALCDAEVDTDALLTLSFYLHVALINEYLQLFSYQDPIDILNDMPVPAGPEYAALRFHESYLECEPLLKEIFNQLSYTSVEASPGWILSWSAACKAAVGKSTLTGGRKLLKDLRNIIDDQLGFDHELKYLLDYFVRQTYKSKSDQ